MLFLHSQELQFRLFKIESRMTTFNFQLLLREHNKISYKFIWMEFSMKQLICLFLISFLFLISCKNNSTNSTPSQSSEIIPLNMGYYWVYNIVDYDSEGYIIDAYVRYRGIIGSYSEGNKTIFSIKDSLDYNHSLSYYYCYNFKDGYYCNTIQSDNNLQMKYKYPAKVGDTYVNGGYKMTLNAVDVVLSSGAGSFKCYKYMGYAAATGENITEYVCPGTGEIRIEWGKNGILRLTMDLLRYKVE